MGLRGLCGAIWVGFALGGCAGFHLSGPMPSDIGGEQVVKPPVENFRGQPVVQVTFVNGIDPAAESEFLNDYRNFPVTQGGLAIAFSETADFTTARLNLNGMMAKNTFYAFQLAKYLKMKSNGDYAVVLNPVTLKFDFIEGYSYEPVEEHMPPYDIDLNFLSYVDPSSQPSNKGNVITTFGESLAPIVSVRMDPAFNPTVEGAVGLSNPMISHARNPDGRGARAQLIDYLNIAKMGAEPLDLELEDHAKSSGAFEAGSFYGLRLDTYDLEDDPPEEDVLPAEVRDAWNYQPGTYYAYEFFEGYYKVVMSALQIVDNSELVTESQQNYWSYYEKDDLAPVMIKATDRKKRRFLIKAKQVELQYLQDRDDNWMDAVLQSNDFQFSFNKLRDAEQDARDDYVNAQIKAVAGVLLVALGAVATVVTDSNSGGLAGVGAVGVGVALTAGALADLDQIDLVFETAFETAYESQKSYVFETAEGERITVRARDYTDFKRQLKSRYDKRFRSKTVPIS